MPRKKYLINFNDTDCEILVQMTRKGSLKARQFKRAMIFLKADDGLSDPQIMAALDVSWPCVERIRRAEYHDSVQPAFLEVEEAKRWEGCLGVECVKAVPG